MSLSRTPASDEQIVDVMIQLAGATRSQRVIAAGSEAFDIYLGLLHRGFSRAATTTTCRFPCGQHDIALVAGHHSIQALELLLPRLVPFLGTRAIIAVWIDTHERHLGGTIKGLLEQLGFRIEAGTKCDSGFVVSARRRELDHVAKAA